MIVYRGIRLSTAASVVLGLFEIIGFVALAVSLIVSAGAHNTLAVFNPSEHNQHGLGSLVPRALYAVFGIVGFEAAAPLGEEARSPKRTIPKGVVLACLTIGAFYLLCYYAATVYFGPAKMLNFAKLRHRRRRRPVDVDVQFGVGNRLHRGHRGAVQLGRRGVERKLGGDHASRVFTGANQDAAPCPHENPPEGSRHPR